MAEQKERAEARGGDLPRPRQDRAADHDRRRHVHAWRGRQPRRAAPDEDQAERLKKKLAGNPYFKVEGGPDHTQGRRGAAEARGGGQEKRQKLDEKKTQAAAGSSAQRQVEAKRPEQPTLEHAIATQPRPAPQMRSHGNARGAHRRVLKNLGVWQAGQDLPPEDYRVVDEDLDATSPRWRRPTSTSSTTPTTSPTRP